MEFEVSPQLPTSGQLLGVLVDTMGFQDAMLRDRTAKRFFSGRRDEQVKDLSRQETLAAIVDTLAKLGFEATPQSEDDLPFHSVLSSILDEHTVNWDRLRAFLLPRMMRVYPSSLATLWKAYLRLASIDLALRLAALLHYTGASETALDFLEWADVARRGRYLNQQRKKAAIHLINFPAAAEVSRNTAEGWLYRGARPLDENLLKISEALAPRGDPQESGRIVRDLRLLYWTSDVAAVLGKHLGADAVNEIVGHLHRYALQAFRIIHGEEVAASGSVDHRELVMLGVHAPRAEPLLAALAILESDEEWKADLLAATFDWVGRVLEVNLQVHQAEINELIKRTDGRILERWEVRNPKAYEHYQRSEELQVQGRIPEAIAEVAKAVDLDPLDPVNHFTLGSALGGIGGMTGDAGLISRGMQSCWLAHALDPDWILPWAEIGLLLLQLDRAEEAVVHLEGVAPSCGPLDARYYFALGSAQTQVGEHAAALAAFESSLQLSPDDPSVAVAAAVAALMAGDKITSNRYGKVARFLGAGTVLDRTLDIAKAIRAVMTAGAGGGSDDRAFASQDFVINGDPQDAAAYVARARSHFLKGEDSQAVSDLDAALRLDVRNVGALVLRGIVHGYMGSHEQVIADMSQAISLSPGAAMAHHYRGLSYGELNALELAIADFDEAIRLDPGFVQAYQARGECRLYRGEYDAAIADFDTAIELDAESARSYRGRGAVLRMKGDFDQAIANFDTALHRDPVDPYAYRFRGDAYLARGDYDRALADFDVSLHLDPNNEVAHRGRGSAHLFSGNVDLAIADFDAAIACDPASASAYYGRGVARETLGDAAGAESDYQRGRDLGFDETLG